jgi:hypothetical protein
MYRVPRDLRSGSSARLIPRANARASTGFPSLNLKVRLSVNVYVLPSGEIFGAAAATSGMRRKDCGAGLSGYVISRAQVRSSSDHDACVFAMAGSIESSCSGGANTIWKIPPVDAVAASRLASEREDAG